MTNGNDNALPIVDALGRVAGGLTKRECFAAMAMQAFLSQGHTPQGKNTDWTELGWGIGQDVWNDLNRHNSALMNCTAQFAVKCADALIDALNANEVQK